MDTTLTQLALMAEQDKHITETVSRERGRLRNFIRRRVPDADEAEDILQDVFFEYVENYRLPEPIEQVGAWLLSSPSAVAFRRSIGVCAGAGISGAALRLCCR